MNRGSILEGVLILAALFAILILGTKSDGAPYQGLLGGSSGGAPSQGEEAPIAPASTYANRLSLGRGNASYTYQPFEEYINIYNGSGQAVDITGWQLRNAKDKRPYERGDNLQYFSADVATIPQGTLYLSPSGPNIMQDVILEPGETAIVTTGTLGPRTPYEITSFKENMCSGYLEDLDGYDFTPPLERSCRRPSQEPGIESVGQSCHDFIDRMQSCHTPKFDTRDREGNVCSHCADGQPLSSTCVAFLKSHYSYTGCVANHLNETGFSGDTWRVFLNRGWEMWADKYETIYLLDRAGHLVDSISY